MNDSYGNRLAMFKTSGGMVFDPKWLNVWQGRPPAIFATKAAEAAAATNELAEFCRRQGVVEFAGADKDREETELENAAFAQARALVCYHRDRDDEREASKFDFPISWWRKLRDTDLLTNAETVRIAVASLAAGSDAAKAEPYGLTAASASALKKEWNDYDVVVTKPRQVVGDRKALTDQLRDRFNEVEAKFEALDDIAVQFATTPEGREFVAAYTAARNVVDRGAHVPDEAAAVPVPA